MRRRIRKNDIVMVITGADKGKTGRVLRIIGDRQRVVVIRVIDVDPAQPNLLAVRNRDRKRCGLRDAIRRVVECVGVGLRRIENGSRFKIGMVGLLL